MRGLVPNRRLKHKANPSMATESHEAGRKILGERARQLWAHQRLIDDLRDEEGRPTGKLRCVKCKAVFPDPDERSHPQQAANKAWLSTTLCLP